MINIGFFKSENSQFLEVQFSVYLNRRVFVMGPLQTLKTHRSDAAEFGIRALDIHVLPLYYIAFKITETDDDDYYYVFYALRKHAYSNIKKKITSEN